MLEKIKALVEFAYENVPLYHNLYGERPELRSIEDFRQLPCAKRSDFVLRRIEDILSDVDEATVILPPIENKAIFPFPRLESAADRDSRYEVFYFLLKQAGVIEGASFLIITDGKHSYYCGEVANNLLYYGHRTWIMLLRDHSAEEVQTWIDRFEPDCLLLALDQIPEGVARWGVPSIFTINQYYRVLSSGTMETKRCSKTKPNETKPSTEARNCISHFDIYAITEVGWIGIRLPGGHYVYPEEYFHIEADPRDNILTLTALESRLQPFIRYKTSDRGEVLSNGMFRVTYIGEH
jgi:hypothetical protein